MKKLLSLLVALLMVFTVVGCSVEKAEPAGTEEGETITLWTYPIGGWGDDATVQGLLEGFKAETGITVNVEYLDYTNGDDQVNTAIEGKTTPDLIMEGPERLVANWGDKGYMVDLSDLLDATDEAEINAAALAACKHTSGAVYEYPVVMTAHCMAVNVAALEEAGVKDLVDLESHTWTTDTFFTVVNALYATYGDTVAAVFCGGQGGDQGTRALYNNLYGGTFAKADHSGYTMDDPNNIKALEALSTTDGIAFDSSIVGGDEITMFRNGTFKMAFCWNIAQQLTGDKTDAGDEIAFMAFPSQNATDVKLCGGIWGFGVFDNGNDAKVAAAKTFIKYMADSEHTADAVKAAKYFAVRDTAEGADLTGIWADNAIMNDYNSLMPYLGDYYQVTAKWPEARTAAWNMLQQIGTGTPVADAVATFQAAVK